jgi:hypothetical protein
MATQASCTTSPEVENAVNSANPLKTLPTKPKKTGDLVLLTANEPHGLQATSRFKMMLTMLRS